MNVYGPPQQTHSFKLFSIPGQAPATLLLFVWLAESAWVYLACSFAAAAGDGAPFTPVSVLLPYGMATIVTLLLQRRATGRRGDGETGRRGDTAQHSVLSPQSSAPGTGRRQEPPPTELSAGRAVAITALHLLAGLLSLLATAWWELYRQEPLLDPGWIRVAAYDIREPIGHGLPPLAWLLVLGLFLWWRGTQLTQEGDDFHPLFSRFLLATAILLGISAMEGQLPESTRIGWWSAAYLVFGLGALPAARLEATRRGRQGEMDRGWQWRGLAIALLLLAASFGVAFLLSPALMEVARGLWELLVKVILPAALEVLRWIAHLLGWDKPPQLLPAEPGPVLPRSEGPSFSLPEWLRPAGRAVFDLAWITLILYALVLWVSRWMRARHGWAVGNTTREKMPWGQRFDPKALLLHLLQWLLPHWPWLLRRVGWPGAEVERADTIREIYRQMLKWGEDRGCPRASWATPREYRTTLCIAWPALEGDFHTITESFLRARYAGLPATQQELAAALDGWRRVSTSSVDRIRDAVPR